MAIVRSNELYSKFPRQPPRGFAHFYFRSKPVILNFDIKIISEQIFEFRGNTFGLIVIAGYKMRADNAASTSCHGNEAVVIFFEHRK